MSETKWTPGPWSISKRNDPENPFSIISGAASGRAYAVAMCPRYRGDDWAGDASLIAAAPELYEALKDLDEAYCDVHPDMTREARDFGRKALIAARSAMAKARGEQP